jgi:hypothetical protein
MTEQRSLFTADLPPEFVDEWQRLESITRKRGVVVVDAVVRVKGACTIALRVDGKKFAVIQRTSPEAAARDLFTQAHGPIPEDNAHV